MTEQTKKSKNLVYFSSARHTETRKKEGMVILYLKEEETLDMLDALEVALKESKINGQTGAKISIVFREGVTQDGVKYDTAHAFIDGKQEQKNNASTGRDTTAGTRRSGGRGTDEVSERGREAANRYVSRNKRVD